MLGSTVEEVRGFKLPSYRQAFVHFYHLHKGKNLPTRDALRQTVRVVQTFWKRAKLPSKGIPPAAAAEGEAGGDEWHRQSLPEA